VCGVSFEDVFVASIVEPYDVPRTIVAQDYVEAYAVFGIVIMQLAIGELVLILEDVVVWISIERLAPIELEVVWS
ncbi:hypothetical protein KI387_001031, partial [Taxus chinensis]